jgi:hypothetical protein
LEWLRLTSLEFEQITVGSRADDRVDVRQGRETPPLSRRITTRAASMVDLARRPAWYDFNTMPVLTFKVSEPEARVIRAKARAARASLSAYLRRAALGHASDTRAVRVVRRRHPVSGLTYNAASRRGVTDDEIRAALADFP